MKNTTRNKSSSDMKLEGIDAVTAHARFQELREKQNLRAAVGKLGKNNYFAYKITAISIKLMINVSVGTLFYLLLVGLFNKLSNHLQLFHNFSNLAVSLVQTSYFSMEKVLSGKTA